MLSILEIIELILDFIRYIIPLPFFYVGGYFLVSLYHKDKSKPEKKKFAFKGALLGTFLNAILDLLSF